MTRLICDTCKTQEPPNNNLPPTGWISAWRRGGTMGDVHFCGPACAETFFHALRDDEAAAAMRAAEQQVQATTSIETGLRLQ